MATPKGLDNLVLMFDDLHDAIARYRALGFTVIPGGSHANGTDVALVAFADGSYLQLMAFHTPSPDHRWWNAREQGGGFIGLCLSTETIGDDVRAARAAGIPMHEPERGGRTRPDGYRVEWSIAITPQPFMAELPVLVQDHTPHDERVPRERAHDNGVTGIAMVTIVTDDLARARGWWSALLGTPGEHVECPNIGAAGFHFATGRHAIEVLTPHHATGPIAAWLGARGPSPYAAVLRGGPPRVLDERRAGARLRIE